jgi:hypothetical protein
MSVELPIVEGSSLDDSPQDPQIVYVLWLRIVLDLFSDAVFSGTERKGNTLYHSSNPKGDREWYGLLPSSDQNTLLLTVKDVLHSLYRLLLHVGEDVRVGVEGDSYRGVSEHLLNDLWMNSPG